MQHKFYRFSARIACLQLSLVAFVVLTVSGCGIQTYESRLGETVKYFEFREKVDSALVPEANKWNEFGIQFRPPQEFQMMPAPPPRETDDDGNPIGPVPRDDRQPNFFRTRVVLPGLLGGWRGVLPVDGNPNPNAPCYIYIMGNYQLWLDNEKDNSIDPMAIFQDFVDATATELGARMPEADDSGWQDVRIPPGISYMVKKNFQTITYQGRANGRDAEIRVLFHEPPESDIRVIVMFVVPAGLDRPGKLDEALDYALQTMVISPNKPTNRGGASAGGF